MIGDSSRAARFAQRVVRRRSAYVETAESIEHLLLHKRMDAKSYRELRSIARRLRRRGERDTT